MLTQAMQQARNDLTSMIALDPDEWSWGAIHQLELVNPTLGESGISAVEALFNRGPFDLAGGGGAVNATSWLADDGFDADAVPSLRMVVPMDDLDAARWITIGGASGHAFSGNYDDQTELWADGETLAWPFTPEAVDDVAEHALRLIPPGWSEP